MDNDNELNQPEIYDISVNNPLAQSFLEKSAFLRFLIQQTKQVLDADGTVIGDKIQYNNFVGQIEKVRSEVVSIRQKIQVNIDSFKDSLNEINTRRRTLSQQIMLLTRQRQSGALTQDDYLSKKYDLEKKRKVLGNQTQLLNKNISIYNNLLNTTIVMDSFESVPVERDQMDSAEQEDREIGVLEAVEEVFESDEVIEELDIDDEVGEDADEWEERTGPLNDDSDLLLENSQDGITYMGVLSTDIEQALAERKKKTLKAKSALYDPSDSEKQPRLNIITETGKQYFFPLTVDRPIRIGRSSQNDIMIPSPAVSRMHSEIKFEGGAFYIHDLESSNGTFVNDKMVIRRKIEVNDTISIGGTRLIFLL